MSRARPRRPLAPAALVALALASPGAAAGDGPATPRPWFEGLDHAAEVAALSGAEITRVRSLEAYLKKRDVPWSGSNPLLLLDLAGGRKAVFRHEDEPWGSVAEVAGYRLSRALGMRLVPPTAPRTLTRESWPADTPWPWRGERRPGSAQLFVEARPSDQGNPRPLTPGETADIEVLSFLAGKIDNHAGNLLRDRSGAPVAIDFENALDLQQTRWGEFPYIRRGQRHREPGRQNPAWGDPFPFDSPRVLVDPSPADLKATFGPWLRRGWAKNFLRALPKRIANVPGRRLAYVIYDDQAWFQLAIRARHPAYTPAIRPEVSARLATLPAYRELFPPPFGTRHQALFEARRAQLLALRRAAPPAPERRPSRPPEPGEVRPALTGPER